MRRGFTIFLIAWFALGPLSAAVDDGDNASLPACCRRHGAHHCAEMLAAAMARAAESSSAPAVSAPLTCPSYPGAALALLVRTHALVPSPASFESVLSHARKIADGHTAPPSILSRSHAGRGPPIAELS